jgi:hypothetical protein
VSTMWASWRFLDIRGTTTCNLNKLEIWSGFSISYLKFVFELWVWSLASVFMSEAKCSLAVLAMFTTLFCCKPHLTNISYGKLRHEPNSLHSTYIRLVLVVAAINHRPVGTHRCMINSTYVAHVRTGRAPSALELAMVSTIRPVSRR